MVEQGAGLSPAAPRRAFADAPRVCCEPVKATVTARVSGSEPAGRIPPCRCEATSVGVGVGGGAEHKSVHGRLHLHAVEQRRNDAATAKSSAQRGAKRGRCQTLQKITGICSILK